MGFLSDWGETIMVSLAFVAVIGIIIVNLNSQYGQNNVMTLTYNTTFSKFVNYSNQSASSIQGGTITTSSYDGITLTDTYNIMKDFITITWNFLNGEWIEQVIGMMYLGDSGVVIALTFRVLWFISLIWGIIYVLMKVKP